MKAMRIFIMIFLSLISVVGLAAAAQLANYDQSFSLGTTGTLHVKLGTGDIQIRAGSGGRVVVVGLDQRDLPDLDVQQQGADLSVIFDPRRSYSSDLRFEITVPETFDLDLTTAGGDVDVLDEFLGDINGKTAGGDIGLRTIRGQVNVKTAGGDIQVGVVGKNAELTTAGGDIEVTSVEGFLIAKTAGGDIDIGDILSEAKVSTAGGDVRLGNVGGSVEASTAGGDVIVGNVEGSAELQTSGGDIELQGASGEVTAKTSGGDLNLKNVSGYIMGKTAGGDISAELAPSGEAPSELTTAGGDIHLRLHSPAPVEARIKISGRSGNHADYNIYRNGAPVGTYDAARGEIVYSSGGAGPVIRLVTANGDIRID